MIVGHLGLAAAIRGGVPRASLLWLLPASVAPDLVDIFFAVAGICSPNGLYSHTAPTVALVAAAIGGAAYLLSAQTDATAGAAATAVGCVAVIVLHPVLDFVTGYKLFWPGGELMGLRLYERPLADFLVEAAIATVAWIGLRRSPGVPRWARAPVAICVLLLLQGAANFGLRGLKPSGCMTSVALPL